MKKRNYFKLVELLIVIASFVVFIVVPGTLILKNSEAFIAWRKTIIIIASVWAGVSMLLSIILGIVFSRKLKKAKEPKKYLASSAKEYLNLTKKSTFIKASIATVFGYIYFFATLILFVFAALVIVSQPNFGTVLASALFFIPVYNGFYSLFFEPPKPKTMTEDKNLYPYFNKLMDEAKSESGMQDNCNLYVFAGHNLAIAKFNDSMGLGAGISLLQILSDREFKAFMIHKMLCEISFNKAKKSPIVKLADIYTIMIGKSSLLNVLSVIVFSWISVLSANTFEKYIKHYMLNAVYDADEKIKNSQFSQDFIHAFAKNQILTEFFTHEASVSLYAGDGAIDNYLNIIHTEFEKFYNTNSQKFMDIITKILPETTPVAPNLNERLDSFNINSLNITFDNQTEEYKNTLALSVSDKNKGLFSTFSTTFEAEKAKEYTPFKELTDKYEALSNEEKENLDSSEFAKYAHAYTAISKHETAKELYKKSLEKYSDNALALYHKGFYMLNSFDGGGIDYVKKAIERNKNYFGSGMELLLSYAKKQGDKKIHNDFIDWGKAQLNQALQKNKDDFSFKKSDIYSKSDCLETKEIKLLLDKTKSLTCVIEINLIAKKSKNGAVVNLVGVVFSPIFKQEDIAKAYDEIFFILDNTDNDNNYALLMLNNNKILTDIFNKVDGCNIYKQSTEVNANNIFV